MRNCKQIIELASKKMDSELPWLTYLEVTIHLLMCKTCNRYAKQLSVMQKALSVMEGHVQSQKLSEVAKQRIAQKLQQAKTGVDR